MLRSGISLDQIETMLAVVESQSFSAAARQLGRAQSAVTYAIHKLEEQLGCILFDRTPYRPTLTEAGKSLLPYVRGLAGEAANLAAQARAIEKGIEPTLAIVVDAMFPVQRLIVALSEWSEHFPTVTPRIFMEPMGTSARLLLDGVAQIGLLVEFSPRYEQFDRRPLGSVELVLVAGAHHPLATMDQALPAHELRRHVQLVLTDRSGMTGDRDEGVLSARTWRLGDLTAKHQMLRAGLGFGSMPLHWVEDDLRNGVLKLLTREEDLSQPGPLHLSLCSAVVQGATPGPAEKYFLQVIHQTS